MRILNRGEPRCLRCRKNSIISDTRDIGVGTRSDKEKYQFLQKTLSYEFMYKITIQSAGIKNKSKIYFKNFFH